MGCGCVGKVSWSGVEGAVLCRGRGGVVVRLRLCGLFSGLRCAGRVDI